MWASATSEAHDTIFASATPNSTPSVAGSPMAVPGRLARIYVPATDSVDNQSAPRLLKVRWPCLCGKRNTRIAIHVPLSILTADLQVFLFPLPRGLIVVLPLFWFFRILIAAGLLADRASASLRVSHDAPARRPLEMALARPRRCRSWCARSRRNTAATPFFEALFNFVRGGGTNNKAVELCRCMRVRV